MDYTYLVETSANKNMTLDDVFVSNQMNILHILCYHINTDIKYPFIQFMLEKIPYCGFMKEQFTLPSIIYTECVKPIEALVVEKVTTSLQNLNCDVSKVDDTMYKGILFDTFDRPYALINITGVDITGLKLSRNSVTWFGLPSEIINQTKICNIDIEEDVVELFTSKPEISLLTNNKTNNSFIIPDVVYTGGEIKSVEFNALFGTPKEKVYEKCGKYYYFYKSFTNAIKEGGWVPIGGNNLIDKTNINFTHNAAGRLLIDNDYGRYITGGINRYALFVEGKIYIEYTNELSLTDDMINSSYSEPCIILGYNKDNYKPDVLVKEYENFFPLSYHVLNKSLLGEKYNQESKSGYMIK